MDHMDQPPEVDPIGAQNMLFAQSQPPPPSALLASPGRLFPLLNDNNASASASLATEHIASSSSTSSIDTARKQARRKAAPYSNAGLRPGIERATTATSSASNADGTEEDSNEPSTSNPRKSRGSGVSQTLTSKLPTTKFTS